MSLFEVDTRSKSDFSIRQCLGAIYIKFYESSNRSSFGMLKRSFPRGQIDTNDHGRLG